MHLLELKISLAFLINRKKVMSESYLQQAFPINCFLLIAFSFTIENYSFYYFLFWISHPSPAPPVLNVLYCLWTFSKLLLIFCSFSLKSTKCPELLKW